MNQPSRQKLIVTARSIFGSSQIILTVVSLFALFITFWLTNLEIDFERKVFIFLAVIVVYLIFCISIYFWQKKRAKSFVEDSFESDSQETFNPEVENRLFALEEANQFFGASLKPHDMFRLVASRVSELVPFSDCLLLLSDEAQANLKIAFAEGSGGQQLKNTGYDQNAGLAGKALRSGKIEKDDALVIERSVISRNSLKSWHSAVAVPLFHKSKVFGVLELFAGEEINFDKNSVVLLEAVAERIAPLFVNSMTFEQNLSNALTDLLTSLPNERAFFLVLENQIAESVRFPEERPLTILTIDLKNFTEINQKLGHATGDRILNFVGDIIKHQLRQMDFLARAVGDEFLAVLPTASEKTAREICERIEHDFVTKQFKLSQGENVSIKLNFGSATFGKDGETAQRMLAAALLRKQQAKSVEPNKILWFPKEYVN